MGKLVDLIKLPLRANNVYKAGANTSSNFYILTPKCKMIFPNYYDGNRSPNLVIYGYSGVGTNHSVNHTWYNAGTYVWSSKNSWGTELNVVFDLYRAKQVKYIELIDSVLGNRNTTLYKVQLQCSSDGNSWTNASSTFTKSETSTSYTNSDVDRCIITLDSTTTSKYRYWRLHYTRDANTASQVVGFDSISMMGYEE